MYTNYFPYGMERYLIGGMFIGLGVALLFVSTGRLGGASTFFSAAWSWVTDLPFFQQASLRDSRLWRLVYALGMVLVLVVIAGLADGTPNLRRILPFIEKNGLWEGKESRRLAGGQFEVGIPMILILEGDNGTASLFGRPRFSTSFGPDDLDGAKSLRS